MKRLILLLCVCCMLCSCGGGLSSDELMARLITDAPDLPGSYQVYYSDAAPESDHALGEPLIAQLYYAGFELDALCEDYAILIGSADLPYEIHLLRARAQSNLAELLGALDGRRELLGKHKNDQYRTDVTARTEQAVAYTRGRYAILLVTDDNAALSKLIAKTL